MGIGVVCVEVGNYCGRGDRYVRTLQYMIKKHLPEHNFYCITDTKKDDIKCIDAHSELKGWWQKIYMFKPELFDEERLIFFDLDTFIIKNIEGLANYKGDFAMLKDFWAPIPASGVMLWKNGNNIWKQYESEGLPQTNPYGDGGWLGERFKCDLLQEVYPADYFVSYKTECIKDVPKRAHVVCFHGEPRPHAAKGWPRDIWNRYKPIERNVRAD